MLLTLIQVSRQFITVALSTVSEAALISNIIKTAVSLLSEADKGDIRYLDEGTFLCHVMQ